MDNLPVKILVPQKEMPHEYLMDLNKQMVDILNNKQYPADIKNQLFQQVLETYNITRDRIRQPVELEIQNFHPETTENRPADNILQGLLATIPKTIQGKAEALYNRIMSSKRLTVSDKGEVLIDDQVIRGSNVIDLINDLSRKRKTRPPLGYKELAQVLNAENIPRELVGNPDRWNLISEGPSPQFYTKHKPSTYDSSLEVSDNSSRTISNDPLKRLPNYKRTRRVAKDSYQTPLKWKRY